MILEVGGMNYKYNNSLTPQQWGFLDMVNNPFINPIPQDFTSYQQHVKIHPASWHTAI